ncbi:MAG TPA: hypothetical protein VM077_01300 [Candidatus Limnocylindrales bacterium]|nr:hypothetical protein [Candidatus Limnocylindrales bacterium]
MKKHEHLSTAKALIALLSLGIVFTLYWKFQENQNYFFEDPYALKGYVVATIIGAGFLIGLMYFASQTTHSKVAKSTKSIRSIKRKKK